MSATDPAADENKRRINYLPLNHKSRVCKGCKRSRSAGQYQGDSQYCGQCVKRGVTTCDSTHMVKLVPPNKKK